MSEGQGTTTERDGLLLGHHSAAESSGSTTKLLSRRVLWIAFFFVGAAFAVAATVTLLTEDREATEAKQTITVSLNGKHHHHDDEEVDEADDSDHDKPSCSDGKYSKRTLKLAYELPFQALFRDHKGQRKYEASSVVVVGEDAYAVCDSSWAISKFGADLRPFAPENVQLGEVDREEEDSGYEALVYDEGTFYVVRESVQDEDDSYHAIIEELVMGDLDYSISMQCPSQFEFEGDSKGFEGAVAIRDLDNELVLIGLCEGNHCSEEQKKDKGHGRLVAMKKDVDDDGDCYWKTIRQIAIPSSAFFEDYSAITMNDVGKVGISSQEESQFWVGQLLGKTPGGLWDIEGMEFDSEVGKTFDFPKNDSCETIYCNVEGVTWINDDMIMAVSDKMKGHGKQDYRCFDKDQSVHTFVLPG